MSAPPSLYSLTLRPMRLLMQLANIVPGDCLRSVAAFRLLYELWTWLHLAFFTTLALGLSYMHIFRADSIYDISDQLSGGLDVIGMTTLAWAHIVTQVESSRKGPQYEVIFRKFEAIRSQLDQQLNVTVDCSNMARHARRLYAFFAFYFAVIVIIHYFLYINDQFTVSLTCSLYSELVVIVKLFEFMLFAVVVFVLLGELHAAGEKFVAEAQRQRTCLSRDSFARIFALQDVHAQLWSCARRIEDYFEWSLPSVLVKIFVDDMLLCYFVYLSWEVSIDNMTKIYCVVFMLAQFSCIVVTFFVAGACERMHRKFRALFLHVSFDEGPPEMDMCLRDVSLQMMHEPIRFTAGEFLLINRNTLGGFTASQILLTVILIQFRTSTF